MNVYDMEADGGGHWVWLFKKDNLVIPLDSADEAAFLETHKRNAARRNTDRMDKGVIQKLADCSNVSHGGHPMFNERCKQVHESCVLAASSTTVRVAANSNGRDPAGSDAVPGRRWARRWCLKPILTDSMQDP